MKKILFIAILIINVIMFINCEEADFDEQENYLRILSHQDDEWISVFDDNNTYSLWAVRNPSNNDDEIQNLTIYGVKKDEDVNELETIYLQIDNPLNNPLFNIAYQSGNRTKYIYLPENNEEYELDYMDFSFQDIQHSNQKMKGLFKNISTSYWDWQKASTIEQDIEIQFQINNTSNYSQYNHFLQNRLALNYIACAYDIYENLDIKGRLSFDYYITDANRYRYIWTNDNYLHFYANNENAIFTDNVGTATNNINYEVEFEFTDFEAKTYSKVSDAFGTSHARIAIDHNSKGALSSFDAYYSSAVSSPNQTALNATINSITEINSNNVCASLNASSICNIMPDSNVCKFLSNETLCDAIDTAGTCDDANVQSICQSDTELTDICSVIGQSQICQLAKSENLVLVDITFDASNLFQVQRNLSTNINLKNANCIFVYTKSAE